MTIFTRRSVSLFPAASAVAVGADAQTLIGFARLPADTFEAGPTSGQFITPANNRTPPFVGAQQVQGFSSILRTANGEFLAMSDNGLGLQETARGCTRLPRSRLLDGRARADRRNAPKDETVADHYETLQISANAEPETIHRVFRLLAQRFHPDNKDTGNAARFRELTEAYEALSDPERRAQYDAVHHQVYRERWKIIEGSNSNGDVRGEQIVRLTLLELLYTRRRTEPSTPGLSMLDVEALIGRPREHLEFSIWYLTQKKFVSRGDDSSLTITAEGVEYLENNFDGITQTRLLRAQND